jgi:hypothetical protein
MKTAICFLCLLLPTRVLSLETATVDCSNSEVLKCLEDDELITALLRHLCASARWRVQGGDEKEFYALQTNVHRIGSKRVLYEDIEDIDDIIEDNAFLHILIVLNGKSESTNVVENKGTICQAGDSKVKVEIVTSTDDSHTYDSDLIIKSKRITIKISERNRQKDRTLTQRAINDVMKELRAVCNCADVINKVGYMKEVLPKTSMRKSDNFATLAVAYASTRPGIYLVSGYVNEHEKGFITIRTIDDDTGEDLAPENDIKTKEYVGWSSSKSEWFFFESDWIAIGQDGKAKNVRFELWFHPEKGAKRKIYEVTKPIIGWKR